MAPALDDFALLRNPVDYPLSIFFLEGRIRAKDYLMKFLLA
jgi:hypothetical protein